MNSHSVGNTVFSCPIWEWSGVEGGGWSQHIGKNCIMQTSYEKNRVTRKHGHLRTLLAVACSIYIVGHYTFTQWCGSWCFQFPQWLSE